jgi:hypothetical protein
LLIGSVCIAQLLAALPLALEFCHVFLFLWSQWPPE